MASPARFVPPPNTRLGRVLVTGADGFVGRHLLAALADSPATVIAAGTDEVDAAAAEHLQFNLLDAAAVSAAIAAARPDTVVHLAGQSSVAGSATSAAATWAVNVAGSLNLARALAEHSPACMVLFASSAEVYGKTFLDRIVNEQSLTQPTSPYGRSKAAAEAMFDDVLPTSAKLIVARASNHSGPGQSATFVIPSFAQQIAQGEHHSGLVVKVGQLDNRRDFLDVRDVVAAYLRLLVAAPQLPSRSIFNIASGVSVRIGDVLNSLGRLSHRPFTIQPDQSRTRIAEITEARLDNAAITALGWQPRIALEATLADVLAEQRAIVAAEGAAMKNSAPLRD